MDSVLGQQGLQGTLVLLGLLEEVSDDFPPRSLGLLFGPPEGGQQRGVQQREHTVVVDQEEAGLQELSVPLGKQRQPARVTVGGTHHYA